MNAALDEEINRLDQAEKLALIARIWSTIDADALPVPPSVLEELERRRADLERNPQSALTLDELMARVQRRL